jgi:hypothetical protein
VKRFSLSRPAAPAGRNRSTPRLEILEDRLPPGDVVCGALLGWGAVAASDAPPPAIDARDGLSHQARLLADLGGTDGLASLTEVNRAAEPASATALIAGPLAGVQQGLLDPVGAQGAPASRLVAEGQEGNAASSAGVFVTAPAGPGIPVPAFAAVAGAVVQHPPSALAAAASRPETGAAAVNRAQALNNLGGTGLGFEPNVGQTDPRVDYLARTRSGTVFLTPTAAVFAMQKPPSGPPSVDTNAAAGMPSPKLATPGLCGGVTVFMQIVGANPATRPVGQEEFPGKVNYFLGNDPARWHTDIPTYGRVEYPNVYPGISLTYYGGPDGLEYDFVLSPGADARTIALRFEGADGADLNSQGGLVVHTAAGDLVQHAPVVYQESGSQRQPVPGRLVLDSGLVRFDVGAYDRGRPLVIDPVVLGYSTYLGGSGDDRAFAVAVDAAGDAYVAGDTGSRRFPTNSGAFDGTYNGNYDIFVAKLSPDGGTLLYGTYIGGKDIDQSPRLAVDGAGNAYLTGNTSSKDFPVTAGAFDTTYNGSSNTYDAFVTKLSPGGDHLAYSTFLGGTGPDDGLGIAVDSAGEAYVAGFTQSADFPTTPGAFQTTFKAIDGFIAKFNVAGSALVYSTLFGGSSPDYAQGIAIDAAGNAFVTGETKSADLPTTPGAFDKVFHGGFYDAFAAKLSSDGSSLLYGTYLGGSGSDAGEAIALDGAGDAYVNGTTDSADFPTTPGAFQVAFRGDDDAFVIKLNAAGGGLEYGTYLGGSQHDESGLEIAVNGAGDAYVTGLTNSRDFPTTPGAWDRSYNDGSFDGYVAELNPSGSALAFSTFLGGSREDEGVGIAVGGADNAYVVGLTASTDFPVTPGAYQTTYHRGGHNGYDAFVAKFGRR